MPESAPSTFWNPRHTFLVFAIAATWNLSAGIVALIAPEFHAGMFFRSPPTGAHIIAEINTQAFWVTVLLFGWGYLMAARDPIHNRGIIWLGLLGKTYAGLLWLWHFAQGKTALLAVAGALGDLAFAAVFGHYLWSTAVHNAGAHSTLARP